MRDFGVQAIEIVGPFERALSDAPAPQAAADTALLLEEVKIGCTIGMLTCLDRPHRLAYILGEILEMEGEEAARVLLRYQDARRLGEDAIAIYRHKHGLLSADQIRGIRERFGLTQADLARLLRLGANTPSRWEWGRNVQTEAMDMLLRLIRDLPGSIDYLRHHAA